MHDWTGSRIQAEALAVKCPHCLSEPGELCTYDGRTLRAFPAHTKRISLAQQGAQS